MTPTSQRARLAALVCLLATTGCAGDPRSAAPARLSIAGQIGGAAHAAVAQDGTAWVGIGPRVVAFAPLPSAPRAMTVFREHVWVVTEDAGLVGYDLGLDRNDLAASLDALDSAAAPALMGSAER